MDISPPFNFCRVLMLISKISVQIIKIFVLFHCLLFTLFVVLAYDNLLTQRSHLSAVNVVFVRDCFGSYERVNIYFPVMMIYGVPLSIQY